MGPLNIVIWFGVPHQVTQLMSYQVLEVSSIPIYIMTVQKLFHLENNSSGFEKHMEVFYWRLEANLNAKLMTNKVCGR